MKNTWKFEDQKNTAVFATVEIICEGKPVLYVSHDEDGDWQFLGSEGASYAQAMLVSLSSVVAGDESIEELYDLPVGWIAQRENVKENWSRKKKPE